MYDSARDAAREADTNGTPAPFRGVPFLLKDLLGNCSGVPTTCASRFLDGVPANHDSELVMRFRRAGLIPIGKTNCSEFGLLPTTEPHLHGACRNPWNTDRSSGGSSGGSAAAVAAGIVPVAHASDGGGSIRIPASCCGLVGMKPTRARNTFAPLIGDVMNGLVVEHAVSRSVRDSAALLDCTAGPGIGDPYVAPPPERPYLEEVSRDPGRLRVAIWSRNIRGGEIDPECREAIENTASLLVELGHEVEEVAPPVDADMITDAFLTIWTAGAAATIDLLQLSAGRKATRDLFEPLTWALYERGQDDPRFGLPTRSFSDTARVATNCCILRDLRRLVFINARQAPATARQSRWPRDRHRKGLRADHRVPELHTDLQRDRSAGRLFAASLDGLRIAGRGPDRGAFRRRGPALPTGRPTGNGAAMDRTQAPELGLGARSRNGRRYRVFSVAESCQKLQER